MPTKEKSPYVEVKARFTYNDRAVEAIVINPGAHHGRAWMVFIDNQAWPDYLIVEAPSPEKAEDVFVDSEHGVDAHIDPEERGDYEPEHIHYSGSGVPYESEGIMVNGAEDEQIPWLCKYHAPGLPDEGVHPPGLEPYSIEECESCGTRCYAHPDEFPSCSKECREELEKLFRW